MSKITIQMGHVPRTSGATGTHREQEFNKKIGPVLADALRARGHVVYLIGADQSVPSCDVFISLHCDGNLNRAIRGASVGYPDDNGGRLAEAWKRAHQRNGFPGGFHRNNYTTALRSYYAFRKTNARYRFLAEHGTTTNGADEAWLFSHLDACVRAHVEAVGEVVGHPVPEPSTEVVKPMYEYTPPVGAKLVANLKHKDGGEVLLWSDGAIWGFDCPFNGAPFGKPYFAGRKAARLVYRQGATGTATDPWYAVITTSGERYGDGGF